MDITIPLMAYDKILDDAKLVGRDPDTADRMLAMRAAILAYEADKENVLPPMRGTDSQHDADARGADADLPPLPQPTSGERVYMGNGNIDDIPYYTAEQMHEYAVLYAGSQPLFKSRQSIDSPEFNALIVKLLDADHAEREGLENEYLSIRRSLIALIDGRANGLLGEILALAKQGMCHGLLADDYCSQIVAKIGATEIGKNMAT